MSKRYKIKADTKLITKLKPFWRELQKLEDEHYGRVQKLEKLMELTTKIEGIEFFMSDDGYYCGIGNADRTMKLIQDFELDKK